MTVDAYERVPVLREARNEGPPSRDLEEIWKTSPGVYGWFATVDHKELGKRYIATAFIFLLIGGIEALVMRVQLARPDQRRNDAHAVTAERGVQDRLSHATRGAVDGDRDDSVHRTVPLRRPA